jgi:hypothetical protein
MLFKKLKVSTLNQTFQYILGIQYIITTYNCRELKQTVFHGTCCKLTYILPSNILKMCLEIFRKHSTKGL